MSIEILDCLKRQRDICVKNVMPSQNTAFMFTPALSLFLAAHSVAMVTYCVNKMMPTCSPVIGQLFNTMIVASSDNEW